MKIKVSSEQLIFYLFCGAFFVMPMGTSPYTILGGCILLVWFISGEFIKGRQGYLGESWFWPVLAMVALIWIGLIYTPDVHGLGIKYAQTTHYWLYAFAIACIPFSRYSADNLIKAFLIGLFLNALVGLLQFANIVPIISRFQTIYTGFYGGYNTLAILLILGMITASYYFKTAVSRNGKLVYACLMLVYFFHLIILTGRAGYWTFALLLPLVIYNIFPKKGLAVVLIIYLLTIGAMSLSPIVQDRFTETISAIQTHFDAGGDFTSGKKYSGSLDRVYMWRWAIHLFLKHPLIGIGTGGYRQEILSAGGDMGIDHPHNNILHMAVSYGILGLLVFGWLFWVLLKTGWRHRDSAPGFFIMTSSLVILVGGLFDTHILDAGGAFLLALTTGLQAALPKEKAI